MNFIQAIQSGFRNYVGFTGRAARSEFWWWALFQALASIAALVVDAAAHIDAIYLLVSLGLALPSIAMVVRRLHDTERSGWWYLMVLVPLVGPILLIVWWCTRGTTGANKHGVDPLMAGGIDAGVFGARDGAISSSSATRLEQLGRLRDQGVLTAAEFEGEKARLLAGHA